MANDTQNTTVEIDIVGNAEAYRQSLKEASSDTAEFLKDVKKQNKTLFKDDKAITAIEKAMRSTSKKDRKEALTHEKALHKVLLQKSKLLSELNKQGKRDSADAKKLRQELKEEASLYTDIKTAREKEDQTTLGGRMKTKATNFGKNVPKALGYGALGLGITAALGVASFAKDTIMGGLGDVDDLYKEQRDASKLDTGFRSKIESQVPGMEKLGIGRTESTRQAVELAKLTGKLDDVLESNKMAFASGMSQEQQAQFMGTLARGGVTSDDGASEREQVKVISAGFASGIKKSRLHEVFTGITHLLDGAQQRTAGDVSAVPYAKILETLGKSGKSGLQGARGASVAQKLESGIAGADKNSAQAAFVRQAFGYGVPGGATPFYQSEKDRQKGFSGEGGEERLAKIIKHVLVTSGGETETAFVKLSELTQGQLSFDQAEEVIKAFGKEMRGDTGAFSKQFKEMQDEIKPADERVADILSDKIWTTLKSSAEADNKIQANTEALRTAIDAYKPDFQRFVASMTDHIPTIAAKMVELTENTINFFKDVKHKFGIGEDIDAASRDLPSNSKQNRKITAALTGLPSNDVNLTADESAKLREDLKGKLPKLQMPGLSEKLPNPAASSNNDTAPATKIVLEPIEIHASVDLTAPDGTKHKVPLETTKPVRINNGKGIKLQ
jgi:hypothetical protein